MSFHAVVDTDVEFSDDEMERMGWVKVGSNRPSSRTVFETVMRWHDDTHSLPWQHCHNDLCKQLNG